MSEYIKLILILFIKTCLKFFWFFPIKKTSILFSTNDGNTFSCNPKYVYLYLHKTYEDELSYCWVLNNPTSFPASESVKTVKFCSLEYFKEILQAHIVITNNGLPSYIPFRKDQILINTWHGGGAYKKCHLKSHTFLGQKLELKTWQRYDYFISTNHYFNKCFNETYQIALDRFLNIGFPRNDIFSDNTILDKQKLKQKIGLPADKNIVVYAPTFRDGRSQFFLQNIISAHTTIEKTLSQKFGGSWLLTVRLHRLCQLPIQDKEIINLSSYDDMQEILYISDALITDFSSSMWDYSLTQKPCFIYAEDIDCYMEERGFYTPIIELPFPISNSIEQLAFEIKNFDKNQYIKRVHEHHQKLEICETLHASQLLGDKIHTLCIKE